MKIQVFMRDGDLIEADLPKFSTLQNLYDILSVEKFLMCNRDIILVDDIQHVHIASYDD